MNKKPNAIVFFDLDGTVLTSDVTILDSTIKAIEKLKQNNIECIVATGRTFFEAKPIMKAAGFDSIISMNGQSIHYKGECIFKNSIPVDVIDNIVQFSKNETQIEMAFYNDKHLFVTNHTKEVKDLYDYLKQPMPQINEDVYLKDHIEMLLLFCQKGEYAYINKFPELRFIRNTPYCVDIFNKNGSKANGIKELINKKNYHNIPTYAFGDGLNDIEMLEYVDHPVAMGNAYQELKDVSKFVTKDNNSDGIALALQKFGLI